MSEDETEGMGKRPKTTVENLQLSRSQRKDIERQNIEDVKEYKKTLNHIATTKSGQYFLRTLIKSLGVYDPINVKQGVDVIVERNVYLRKIRPFLEKDVRQELEAEI